MKQTKITRGIIFIVVICCAIMALTETIIEPPYFVKSAIKIAVFLFLPLIFARANKIQLFDNFTFDKKSAGSLAIGIVVYALIMGAYFLTKNIFDYSALVDSLSADQNVGSGNFILVASYISFCNSFLEEFLFRLVSFIKLSELVSKRTAYVFSSLAFAVYHIAMIGGSFPLPLLILALTGLAVGGLIFDFVDDKSGKIYGSWFIHMFADFAIMTIWYFNMAG